MTTLEKRLKDDVKLAMKAGAKDDLVVLRMVLSELKNAAINEGMEREGFEDAFVLRILRKGVKTRSESAQMYADASRPELEAVERAQIAVLERYLPSALPAEELAALVDAVISELGASSKKEMGAVMKAVMARSQGRADGKAVSALVAGKLG
ncbi:MAG: GatB/YqeY domain-containing protein [Planctomycetota bacterium]|nr:MAG: GatB/YqeY domain-containing protein [Planctomycetota bacterium]